MQQVSVAAGLLSSSVSSLGSFFGDTVRARFLAGVGGLPGGLDERVRLLVRHAVLTGAVDVVVATETAEARLTTREEPARMDVAMVRGLKRPASSKEPTEAIPSEGRKPLTKTAGVIEASGADGDAISFSTIKKNRELTLKQWERD